MFCSTRGLTFTHFTVLCCGQKSETGLRFGRAGGGATPRPAAPLLSGHERGRGSSRGRGRGRGRGMWCGGRRGGWLRQLDLRLRGFFLGEPFVWGERKGAGRGTHLPELGADLVAALASLKVNDCTLGRRAVDRDRESEVGGRRFQRKIRSVRRVFKDNQNHRGRAGARWMLRWRQRGAGLRGGRRHAGEGRGGWGLLSRMMKEGWVVGKGRVVGKFALPKNSLTKSYDLWFQQSSVNHFPGLTKKKKQKNRD